MMRKVKAHIWGLLAMAAAVSIQACGQNGFSSFDEAVECLSALSDTSELRPFINSALKSQEKMDFLLDAAFEAYQSGKFGENFNDEFYMTVADAAYNSGLYEDTAPLYSTLVLLSQNRPGRKANNINFYPEGPDDSLYGIESEYTLVVFEDPDCGDCKENEEDIENSEIITKLLNEGGLVLVRISTGSEVGQNIRDNFTYNLRRFPSMYLLDSDKTVLVKDARDIDIIEYNLNS